MSGLPPLPEGFTLDQPQGGLPPLPAGFKLDSAEAPQQQQPQAPQEPWQKEVKPFRLSNGVETVVRPHDNAVWLDPSKGDASLQPGWYTWSGKAWQQAPARPEKGVLQKAADNLLFNPVTQGITDLAAGGLQMAANLPGVPQGVKEYVNAGIRNREQAYQDLPINQTALAGVTRAVGGAIPLAATGGAAAPATLAGKVGQGAATGAAIGLAQPVVVPEGQSDQFAAEKVKQGALGAAIGGAAPVAVAGAGKALQGAAKVAGKGADLLAGTKLGKTLGITQEIKPQYQGAMELSAELDNAGIKTHTVGDVTGDPAIRHMEESMTRNDERMMALRLKQNKEALAYAEKLLGQLKKTVEETGWKNTSEVVRAAQQGGKRSTEAKMLIQALQNSGDDWGEIVQHSGNLKLFVNKLRADALYDRAETLAEPFGAIPIRSTKAVADSAAKILRSNTAAPNDAKAYLQGIAKGLEDGTQDTTFQGLRTMRSSIMRRIDDLTSGKVSTSSEELPYLKQLKEAVESDLDKFAKSHGPELGDAYRKASEFYRTAVVPYKEVAFGKALADADPVRAANLFKTQNPTQQARFLSLLDDKGRAAVRAGLVGDALATGEKTARGVMGQTFSSAQVANALEKLQDRGTLGVAFPGGEDRWAVNGLARILRTIDRSDNIAFVHNTGVTAESIASKAKGDLTSLGTVAKGIDWLNRDRLFNLYTDPKGRALLQRASMLKPGTPAMDKLIQEDIPRFFSITATRSATAPTPTQEPKP